MPTDAELVELEARRAELRDRYLRPPEDRPTTTGRGIHPAALICSDVEQTIRFYQDVLGFPFFDLGNQTLLGFFDFPGLGLEPGVESIGSVQHIAISAPRDRWEAAQKRLDAAGVPYAGPDLGIPESMYFKDPDGIQIELLSDPLMYFAGKQLDE